MLARPVDDVVYREEVWRIGEVRDRFKFRTDLRRNLLRNAAGIAPVCTLPGQFFEMCLRGGARWHGFVRIRVGQGVEAELAARHDFKRAGNGWLKAIEQAGHFRRSFQVAFCICFQAETGSGQRAVLADTGQHIL